MKGTIKKFLLGTSVIVGASVIAINPAFAGSFSSSGPITVYESFVDTDGQTKTRQVDANTADLSTILTGDSNAPGGNVELYNETDGLTLNEFKNAGPATLTADLDGRVVTFSSLTYDDWFGTGGTSSTAYGADNFANKWFAEAVGKYAPNLNDAQKAGFYQQFLQMNGFQRLSDPNVAYVNKNGNTISFGLAGHSDGSNVVPLLPQGTFASEVIKVSYKGKTELRYSFDKPTDSGQYDVSDGTSHDANFEFSFEWGDDAEKVPEPSAILGLVALGGLAATKGKGKKA